MNYTGNAQTWHGAYHARAWNAFDSDTAELLIESIECSANCSCTDVNIASVTICLEVTSVNKINVICLLL